MEAGWGGAELAVVFVSACICVWSLLQDFIIFTLVSCAITDHQQIL